MTDPGYTKLTKIAPMSSSSQSQVYLKNNKWSPKFNARRMSSASSINSAELDELSQLLEVNLRRKNDRDNEESNAIIDDEGRETNEDDDEGSISLKRSDSSTSVSYIDLSKLMFLSDFDFGFDVDMVSGSKRRFNDMKQKTKQRFQKFKDEARTESNAELVRLNENFIANLSKFDKRLHDNLQSSTTEKLFYALAITLIATCGFMIGKYPQWFHVLHTVLFCVLMPIRFYTYFKQSFQYYLADLCYYVNLLLMLFIWGFPDSPTLFVSVFSLAMGTLSFAVITWRNSLVLHLIEKTTSSFIHIMPPVTLFVIVHELPKEFLEERFPAVASIDKWNFINGIFWTSIYYTAWQVSYHYFITIKRKEQIEKGVVTSFTYLKKKKKNKGLGKFVNSLPYTWMQITAFTLIQFLYQICTMIFCPIWFRYKHACGAFMVFIFSWASYNGATYYIDVFGKRLEKEVDKLKMEVYELQEKNHQHEERSKSQVNLPDIINHDDTKLSVN